MKILMSTIPFSQQLTRVGSRTENDTSFSPSPSKREIYWKFEYFNY